MKRNKECKIVDEKNVAKAITILDASSMNNIKENDAYDFYIDQEYKKNATKHLSKALSYIQEQILL